MKLLLRSVSTFGTDPLELTLSLRHRSRNRRPRSKFSCNGIQLLHYHHRRTQAPNHYERRQNNGTRRWKSRRVRLTRQPSQA